MPCKTDAVVARTIGIDTGKNTLHLIGLDEKGAIILREKLSRGWIAARLANVPRCLIGIEAGMATHARADCARSRGEAGAAGLCQAVPSGPQERFPRRPRDRGSRAAAVDTLRSGEDRRSTGSAGAAPRTISPDWRADSCDQSDPQLSSGAWHPGTPRDTLPP